MRSRTGHHRRGFTLLEGLFSFFLVTLVLGGIVHTLNQAAQVKKNTKNLGRGVDDFHTALTIQNDVHAALSISEPSSGSSSHRLSLRRVDPGLSYTLRTDPIGDALNPYEDSEIIQVEYSLSDGVLQRLITQHDDTQIPGRILRAQNFEVSLDSSPPAILTVQLTLDKGRVEKQRTLRIAVRALP